MLIDYVKLIGEKVWWLLLVFCSICRRVILLNLVHTGNLKFLAIFCNIAANEQEILLKTS